MRHLIVSVNELVLVTIVDIMLLVLVFRWYSYGWSKEFEYALLPNSLQWQQSD